MRGPANATIQSVNYDTSMTHLHGHQEFLIASHYPRLGQLMTHLPDKFSTPTKNQESEDRNPQLWDVRLNELGVAPVQIGELRICFSAPSSPRVSNQHPQESLAGVHVPEPRRNFREGAFAGGAIRGCPAFWGVYRAIQKGNPAILRGLCVYYKMPKHENGLQVVIGKVGREVLQKIVI